MTADDLKQAIRDIPDFPKEGIIFKDITPILGDPARFDAAIRLFTDRHAEAGIDKVACIDARGFLFGGAVAQILGAGVVPVRKKGKLPYKTYDIEYDLEYGSNAIEMHVDAIQPGERVLLIDDLLATGGTAAAAAELIEKAGGKLVEVDFLIELAFLNGREKLEGYEVFAPIIF